MFILDDSKEHVKGRICTECEYMTEDDMDGGINLCTATKSEIEPDYVTGGYNCKMKECKEMNSDGKCTMYKKCTLGKG